jgi:hypothetical protein
VTVEMDGLTEVLVGVGTVEPEVEIVDASVLLG